ncbi:MAG TPA: sensor histidine kinase N-terminal domain-containing protein [Burkholderiaceae bacterium]|nr:sensor histidine kinase N-terminal domain-containing protein [Burkholderiaceae bacterium]
MTAPERASSAQPTGSVKRTLFAWLLLPLLVIVPAGAAVQYWFSARPAIAAFDHALGDTALALANLVRIDDGRVVFELTAETERSLRTDQTDVIYYALVDPMGRLLAGDHELLSINTAEAAGELAYLDARIDTRPVRVAVRGVACGSGACQVRVAETMLKRERMLSGAAKGAAATMLLVVITLAAAIAVGVTRSMRPLGAVGTEIAQRSLEDLRPLEVTAPSEIAPLVNALDRLFERLRHATQAHQAFIADAAHQLRTPLTSLKTEIELALLEPHAPDVDATLRRLHAQATRGARLAGQLLAMARSDPGSQTAEPERLELKEVAGAAADEWVPHAVAAGIDLGFALAPACVRGRRFLLREMLGNLVHNALEYAGRGSEVTVRSYTDHGTPVLEVEDNGPGIAPDERDRVFERFYRAEPRDGNGSGLGLAIVREIADGHGARVDLLDPPGGTGLLVRVRFPNLSA